MSELEDTVVEITKANQKKNEMRVVQRDHWDKEHTNIHVIGAPEGEERKKGPEKLLEEIMAENFPIWGRKQTYRLRNPTEFQIRPTQRETQ